MTKATSKKYKKKKQIKKKITIVVMICLIYELRVIRVMLIVVKRKQLEDISIIKAIHQ